MARECLQDRTGEGFGLGRLPADAVDLNGRGEPSGRLKVVSTLRHLEYLGRPPLGNGAQLAPDPGPARGIHGLAPELPLDQIGQIDTG